MKSAKLFRYLQSYEVETREQRVGLCSSAGTHLALAGDLDPGDHLAQFYLGLLFVVLSAAALKLLKKPTRVTPRHPAKAPRGSRSGPESSPSSARPPSKVTSHPLLFSKVIFSPVSTWQFWCSLPEMSTTKHLDSVDKLSPNTQTTWFYLLSGFHQDFHDFAHHHDLIVFQGKAGGENCRWRGSTGYCQANVSGQQDNFKFKML